MSDLPACVQKAAPVRLLPTLSETAREARAVSTFLSCLKAIRPLAHPLLSPFGAPVGQRSRIECWSEVELRRPVGDRILRPDGLICVRTGSKRWCALVEAKTGPSPLDREQVEAYLRLARENGLDALITLSNQFAPRADHAPVTVNRHLRRSIDLYHLPWKAVLTQSQLALMDESAMNSHERFMLEEFVHYLRQPRSGLSDFTAMTADWADLIEAIQNGAPINRKAGRVHRIVSAWHEELHDAALSLSPNVGTLVTVKVPRKTGTDPADWRDTDAAHFERAHELTGTLQVPHAENMHLTANLSKRTIAAHIRLKAPRDRQRTGARINWLLKQLKGVDAQGVSIRMISKGRGGNPVVTLDALRADPKLAAHDCHAGPPSHFEVALVQHLGAAMGRRRKFIERFDALVLDFYERIGQHVKGWVAPPPAYRAQPVPQKAEPKQPKKPAPRLTPARSVGDIPSFLRRDPHHQVFLQKS